MAGCRCQDCEPDLHAECSADCLVYDCGSSWACCNSDCDDGPPEYGPDDAEAQRIAEGPGQLRAVQARYAKLERADRLAELSRLTGREIASASDLSYVEAKEILTPKEAAT